MVATAPLFAVEAALNGLALRICVGPPRWIQTPGDAKISMIIIVSKGTVVREVLACFSFMRLLLFRARFQRFFKFGIFKIDDTKSSISFSVITAFLLLLFWVLALAPASSIKSIALSGKCL